jgi:hypothetical protein
MNAMLRPSLLSDAGGRSRMFALKGLSVFSMAFVVAGWLGLVVKFYE